MISSSFLSTSFGYQLCFFLNLTSSVTRFFFSFFVFCYCTSLFGSPTAPTTNPCLCINSPTLHHQPFTGSSLQLWFTLQVITSLSCFSPESTSHGSRSQMLHVLFISFTPDVYFTFYATPYVFDALVFPLRLLLLRAWCLLGLTDRLFACLLYVAMLGILEFGIDIGCLLC
jgi:hypothetical protein